ncbi:hypothetical protein B5C34_00310 [Pacificimonas flava]|uniref:(2Fe-2S) ferredoxin domain-containing protein n=2 Tax=Pacificimonas TaxID=1960290 RepID=A0A219B122_9SPHN|nr:MULTISPECIES: hypothetical protein [Pacificimonas]MBZ6378346.1 (2Fe-2S) ferredoxin domain-containing protein [Pacificimonas aurantium]OWV32052.1 hypothetical protein B5C34_00310 [Pacificimonas flava]
MKRVRSNWQGAVLVCGKCQKKLKGGFGPKRKNSLTKELRAHCGLAKGRKGRLGIVEVKCLDICPKKAVVALNTNHSGVWQIIEPGSDMEHVTAALGIDCQAEPGS